MFNCADFLTIARQCMTSTVTEAGDRTAISRSYYAAYHMAHQIFDNPQKRFPKNADAHQLVVASLRSYDEDLGDDLDELKRWRRRADYELDYDAAKFSDTVQWAIDTAHDLIRQLSNPRK